MTLDAMTKWRYAAMALAALVQMTHLSAQQSRRLLPVPDIPGHVTIKADFHLHSVFSDGEVWPTVHVREAWRDGLDAVSLTEHLEYRPHGADVQGGAARAYEAARKVAGELGMLILPGVEITRPVPGAPSPWPVGSAHFNALGVTDVTALEVAELDEALARAKAQGAFVFWNHPGFMGRQAQWFPHIDAVFQKGLFAGVEIVNGDQFYPEALRWVHARRLTPLASSDAHLPMPAHLTSARRPVTLIFSKTRDVAGLIEALRAGRTLAWRDRELWGAAAHLTALWDASLKVSNAEGKAGGALTIQMTNPTAFDFDIKVAATPPWLTLTGGRIPRESMTLLKGRLAANAPEGVQTLRLGVTIDNLRADPDAPLAAELPLTINVRRF
jgi:3',5'-nucleoside bisphosphate phosphatase